METPVSVVKAILRQMVEASNEAQFRAMTRS